MAGTFDKSDDEGPMSRSSLSNETHDTMSASQMIANVESEGGMTDDELMDLTYAFQAADMDGGGAIDTEEFGMMLTVMGCTISDDQINQVIADAKSGFAAWKKLSDDENVAKCKIVWDKYDVDGDGSMDLDEVNAVIAGLHAEGFNPTPMSTADLDDGELDFEEFSAWFLKQEGVPDSFAPPTEGRAGGLGLGGGSGLIKRSMGGLMVPVKMGAKLAMGPLQLMEASVAMIPGASIIPGVHDRNATMDGAKVQGSAEEIANAMLEEKDQIIFAEYVFMMRAGTLTQFLPGDWQERAEDMRKLREAFDTADIDGDNQLELEELEMVTLSMNPSVDVAPEDIKKVWDVLNPDGKDWIPFSDFVAGMITIKRDPALSGIIPMDVPNRFQLLSLLIDSPINEDQEELIFDKMSGLEKAGVKMLRQMEKPMDKSQIRETLDQACQGKLHYLTPVQRKSVVSTHIWW